MPDDVLELLTTTPLRQIAPSVVYPGFLPDLPDLYVLRLPPVLWRAGAGSALNDRYKVVFVECDAERRDVECGLDMPLRLSKGMLDFRLTIDRVMARPSGRPRGEGCCSLYVPPVPGWPCLVVCRLHANIPDAGMARQRYGYDAFDDEEAALDHMARMAATYFPPGMKLDVRVPNRAASS